MWTPLCIPDCIVFVCGDSFWVIILVMKHADTPLLAAAFHGHLDVVEFLVIEANADPNQTDKVWSRL